MASSTEFRVIMVTFLLCLSQPPAIIADVALDLSPRPAPATPAPEPAVPLAYNEGKMFVPSHLLVKNRANGAKVKQMKFVEITDFSNILPCKLAAKIRSSL